MKKQLQVCTECKHEYPFEATRKRCPSDNAPLAVIDEDSNINKLFGDKYMIEKEIGQGGWGTVYLAKHVVLGKPFAVKVLSQELCSSLSHIEKFELEAKTLAKLEHPGVVSVIDYGMTPQPYIVMEYVEGRILAEILEKSGRLNERIIRRLTYGLCEILEYAHERNVVHRDIKPENILVQHWETGELEVKLLDFGISKLVEDGVTKKEEDAEKQEAMGSPAYMSPEQFTREHPIGAPADIYALGCIIFICLTGKNPFIASSYSQWYASHVFAVPRLDINSQTYNKAQKDILSIALQCLSKGPDKRPTASQIKQTVRQISASTPLPIGAIVAAALVLIVGITGFLVTNNAPARKKIVEQTRPATVQEVKKSDARQQLLSVINETAEKVPFKSEKLTVVMPKSRKSVPMWISSPEGAPKGCLIIAVSEHTSTAAIKDVFEQQCMQSGLLLASVRLKPEDGLDLSNCLDAVKKYTKKSGTGSLKTAIGAVELDLGELMKNISQKKNNIDAFLVIDPLGKEYAPDPASLQQVNCDGFYIIDAHLKDGDRQLAVSECEKAFMFSGGKQILFKSNRLSLLGDSSSEQQKIIKGLIRCYLASTLEEDKSLESFLFSQQAVIAVGTTGNLKYR